MTHYLLPKLYQTATVEIKHGGGELQKALISGRETILLPFKEEMLDTSLCGAHESKSFEKCVYFDIDCDWKCSQLQLFN